jgi:soluble lytic murein transglycosylase-like protein/tetratricopeptide (TPR) repeat protein
VLVEAHDHYLQGDMARVVALLTPELAHPKKPLPRDRTPAHMMLGMAHRAHGNWNLASTEFYRVRSTTHPLQRWAAWYEAEADWQRGRPSSTIAECTEIRTTWPSSEQAKECLLLMGDAWADSGKRTQAAALFDQWIAGHTRSPRVEEIKLRKALAVSRASPAHGIPQLKKLVLDHSYHSSAEAAQTALDSLGEAGHKVGIPTDTRTQMRRLASAQRCGRLDAAWEMFLALKGEQSAQRWAAANEEKIAKRTRQWGHYASLLNARYQKKPSGALAWQAFRAYRRAGEWDKAVALGIEAMAEFGGRGRWASAQDDVAWAEIHLGAYAEAHKRWAKLAKGRGKFARQAGFYAAYCAYHAGDLEQARKGFDKVVKSTAAWRAPGYYWRAKVRAAQGDTKGAQADRLQAINSDGEGWYTALISGTAETPVTAVHDGRWHGPPPPRLPTWTAPDARPGTSAVHWQLAELAAPQRAHWLDTLPDKVRSLPPPAKANAPILINVPGRVRDGYVPSKLFEPEAAADSFRRFAAKNASIWPELPAAHDLAQAGMVAEAGVIVGKAYEEWKSPGKFKASAERTASIRGVKVPISTWRQYFILTRDHFHAAVASFGLGRKIKQESDALDAFRLAYPVVEGPALWGLGEDHNVDPLLMLGIMRQESTYRTTIKSHAGAIGLVQVMPATGARLAWLMGDHKYSPGALKQPAVNIRYGTYYMSLLLNRFDGVYPMAIASYNGGPHNVSRWVRNHRGKIDLDAWVEQVEWKETRNYVKRVVGHYARYVALYGEEGAVLELPDRPLGDDPSVVNF